MAEEPMKDPHDHHTPDLFGKLQQARSHWAERERRQDKALATPPNTAPPVPAKASAEIVQPTGQVLPFWSGETRGVPNGILRSALFGAIRRGRRRALEGEVLASVDGVTIRYTGWRLDQADLDVWEYAIHLARQQPLGKPVLFSAHSFLKAIGRKTGNSQHQQLASSLRRLVTAGVEITIGRGKQTRTYMGTLIDQWYRDDQTKLYALCLNPKMTVLWDAGWSVVDWDTRLALKNQPLALWLHGFYSTHADSFPYRVETLHRLCGSECEQLWKFRQELRRSLALLEAAGGIRGWEVTPGDLVKIDRQPSPAQVRHLVQQSGKKRRGRPRKK